MAVPDIGGTWSSRDASKIAGMYKKDGVRHQIALPEARLVGREAIAAAAQSLIDAVPDEVVEIRQVSEEPASRSRLGRRVGGTVIVEWVFKGTHTGESAGWPTKGEAVNLVGVSVCDMDGDLIAEERVYWDTATLLAGAGALG